MTISSTADRGWIAMTQPPFLLYACCRFPSHRSSLHLPPIMLLNRSHCLPQAVRPSMKVKWHPPGLIRMMRMKDDHLPGHRVLRIMQAPIMTRVFRPYRDIIRIPIDDDEIPVIQTCQFLCVKHRQPPLRRKHCSQRQTECGAVPFPAETSSEAPSSPCP